MTPNQVYNSILKYIRKSPNYNRKSPYFICKLHSACKNNYSRCSGQSQIQVIDFDAVKTEADSTLGSKLRKSVDAVVNSPSDSFFCFVELKSWKMCINNNGTIQKIQNQAKKYESDLPKKLADSIEICKQITNDNSIFDNCNIVYILVTDISVDSGISSIDSDLTALAGTSSNLNALCNQLSRNIMNNIPKVQTRYWECRDFDTKLNNL